MKLQQNAGEAEVALGLLTMDLAENQKTGISSTDHAKDRVRTIKSAKIRRRCSLGW
jgi:hypothetical protein